MREIKFRAWDVNPETQRGRFVFIDIAEGLSADAEWALNVLENFQQYTGLKDKNGVEIYEGDIVSYGGKWRAPVGFGELKFWGGYNSDDYYGLGFMAGSEPLDPRGEPLKYIVIGNIYENPELIK